MRYINRYVLFPGSTRNDPIYKSDIPNSIYFLKSDVAIKEGSSNHKRPSSEPTGPLTSDIPLHIAFADTFADRYVVIYFHGNAETIFCWMPVVSEMARFAGVTIISMEYPGYSITGSKLKDTNMHLVDAWACRTYDWITDTLGIKPEDVILMGRSIGSGAVCNLAKVMTRKGKPPGSIYLISGFASIKKRAAEQVGRCLAALLFSGAWDNAKCLSFLDPQRTELLLVHGEDDVVIPIHHSDELYNSFTGKKKLNSIKGSGHNDISVEDFILPLLELIKRKQEGRTKISPSFIITKELHRQLNNRCEREYYK